MNKDEYKKKLFDCHPDRGGNVEEFLKVKREYEDSKKYDYKYEYTHIKSDAYKSTVINSIFDPIPTLDDSFTEIKRKKDVKGLDGDIVQHFFHGDYVFYNPLKDSLYSEYFMDIYHSGYLVPDGRIIPEELKWDESITFWLVRLLSDTKFRIHGLDYKMKFDVVSGEDVISIDDPLFPCKRVLYQFMRTTKYKYLMLYPVKFALNERTKYVALEAYYNASKSDSCFTGPIVIE